MGFTLRIINAPLEGTHWSAHFYSAAEGRFISPPSALALDEIWDCPFNPYGATDLRVLVLDFVHARTVLDVSNLGPVNDGRDYEFNCSTRVLGEVTLEVVPCEITITAPSSAAEGETVNASVKLKNISPYPYSYKATIYAVPDLYPDYAIGSIEQIITSGSSVTRNVSFTMPDCDVTVFIWVERWAVDHWVYDNSASRAVSLEVPEVVPCEITIDAPDSAAEGGRVSVSALLKNVSSYGSMYKTEISAVPDLYPAFRIGTIEKYIDSGSTFTAYGSFTMPASNTTILIWVERWAVDHWVYDNSASRVVSLEVVPEYKGSIARKELEYDETRGAIPVY